MTATKLPLLLAVFFMQAVAGRTILPVLDFCAP